MWVVVLKVIQEIYNMGSNLFQLKVRIFGQINVKLGLTMIRLSQTFEKC